MRRQGSRKKKLADAARHWAAGGAAESEDASGGGDEWKEELRSFGATEAAIEAAFRDRDESAGDEDTFEIWQENNAALEIFLSLRTQWRMVAGMGGAYVQGLDYAGVEALLRLKRVPNRTELFEDLQLMEEAALEVMNKR